MKNSRWAAGIGESTAHQPPHLLCLRHRLLRVDIGCAEREFDKTKTPFTLPALWTHRTRPQVGIVKTSLVYSDAAMFQSSPRPPLYRGYRFPPEIMSHCVWLYYRFGVSLRDVSELMLARGIEVSYQAIGSGPSGSAWSPRDARGARGAPARTSGTSMNSV